MITRRVTFLIGEDGLAAWRLAKLKTLAGYFRSVTILCNLSQRKQASVEHPMRIMSLSALPGDLCQLLIEGSDAELASMVLTNFIDEHATLISGGKRTVSFSPTTYVSLPFAVQRHRLTNTQLDKHALLGEFALQVSKTESLSQEDIFNAMYKRESVSSTCMGHGIALPHVMLAGITQAHILVATSSEPLDWASSRGDVTRIVGLVLPTPPIREQIVAFSCFSQQLLDDTFCEYLTENNDIDIIETIILHALNVPFG
ncbi:PTS sugar transporter subunit IIA [Enterovibrio sp. ZSDZ35]|uniref:PTS sugar transporter subunit IIA n=1 Tax=Enterovibrio qingdaonensis TaxID=2899818 RepID=A0ABT5QLP1_9GAMM|nr:PTS sugar transporter subunit IIA [Enterovibrio sp. ZSDZ35]MDD1781911.1 PTS sugar transporter subunit IIA [Enterovibrio sp. ZSDZ35]